MTSGPNYPEDPGRDPEGLDPPRDFLDKTSGGLPEQGSFEPGRRTQPEQAELPPDEPPTGTEGKGL